MKVHYTQSHIVKPELGKPYEKITALCSVRHRHDIRVTTNRSHVTCKVCAKFLAGWEKSEEIQRQLGKEAVYVSARRIADGIVDLLSSGFTIHDVADMVTSLSNVAEEA